MPEERERGGSRDHGRGPERRSERARGDDREALARRITHFLRGGSGASGESEALREQLHEAAEFLASRSEEEDAGFIHVLHEATAAEFADVNLPDAIVARIARWGQAMGLVLAGHAQRAQGNNGEDLPPLPPDVYHIVNPRLIEAHLDETGRDLHLRLEDGRVGVLLILIDGGVRRDDLLTTLNGAAADARALTRAAYPPPTGLPPLVETVIEADEVEVFADEGSGDAGLTFMLDEGEMVPVLICHLSAPQLESLWEAVREAEPQEH